MSSVKQRIAWIDFGKGLAMLAVIVNHITPYGQPIPNHLTIFSVTSFVLLSGINTANKVAGEPNPAIRNALPAIYAIISSYAIATIVYFMYKHNFRFVLETVVHQLIYFKGSGHFYFIFFFLQLLLISRFLYKITTYYNHPAFHIALLTGTYFLSMLLQQNTTMLPIHGGGKFLFGGSYLFVFHVGIVASIYLQKISKSKSLNTLFFCISFICITILAIGGYLVKAWSNPPNKYAIIYTICIMAIIMSVSNLLSLFRISLIDRITLPIQYIGKHSLNVYLYHLLFIQAAWAAHLPSRLPIGGQRFSNLFWLTLAGVIPPLLISALPRGFAWISGRLFTAQMKTVSSK